MTFPAEGIVEAWSGVLGVPTVTELAPGRVWELTTLRRDRYVLKKLSAFGVPDPVRRFVDEARILTYLLQRGVPVAAPVLSDGGRVCVTDHDGVAHAVFPMLPKGAAGDDGSPERLLWDNVGAAVAGMHVALAGCPFGVESWQVGPGTLTAVWRTVQARLPAAAVAELAARVEPRWEAMLRALSAPPQRVHGDLHGGNLLTDGDRVTGIIDCDHLPLAPRAYDLGYFLAFSVRWRSDRDQLPRPVEEARRVLRGYDGVSPLTDRERRDVPALALEVTLALIDHFARQHDVVEDSWVRAATRIGDDFDALELALATPPEPPPSAPAARSPRDGTGRTVADHRAAG